jgi:hypothetical protein
MEARDHICNSMPISPDFRDKDIHLYAGKLVSFGAAGKRFMPRWRRGSCRTRFAGTEVKLSARSDLSFAQARQIGWEEAHANQLATPPRDLGIEHLLGEIVEQLNSAWQFKIGGEPQPCTTAEAVINLAVDQKSIIQIEDHAAPEMRAPTRLQPFVPASRLRFDHRVARLSSAGEISPRDLDGLQDGTGSDFRIMRRGHRTAPVATGVNKNLSAFRGLGCCLQKSCKCDEETP